MPALRVFESKPLNPPKPLNPQNPEPLNPSLGGPQPLGEAEVLRALATGKVRASPDRDS